MTRITTHDCVRMAAALTGVPVSAIRGESKRKRLVHVRAAIAVLMRRHGKSMPCIAMALGRNDHACVNNYFKHWEEREEVQDLADLIAAALARTPPWHARHAVSEGDHARTSP